MLLGEFQRCLIPKRLPNPHLLTLLDEDEAKNVGRPSSKHARPGTPVRASPLALGTAQQQPRLTECLCVICIICRRRNTMHPNVLQAVDAPRAPLPG